MKLKILLAALSVALLTGCSSKKSQLNNYLAQGSDKFSGESINISEDNFDITQHNNSSDNFKSVYFKFNNFAISANMDDNMHSNIDVANGTQDYIIVEGNCDEFGTDEYNYALGLKRAKSVKDALVSNGVNEGQINVVTLGESAPVCSSQTKNCYKLNRRVDLKLSK